MVKFEISGSKELQAKFRKLERSGQTAALRGLKITALEVLNDAKERLSNGGQRVTAKLFNSGKVVASEEQNGYDVVFGDLGKEVSYAYFVEFGRRAGKMPPVDYIREWVKKKGIADTYNIKTKKQANRGNDFDDRAMSVAFMIARSIAKKGTKARPFLFPALEAKKGNVIKNIEAELNKEIADLMR